MAYQPRWTIYCDLIGKKCSDPTIKNYQYMFWIQKNADEYKRQKGIDVIVDHDDFTAWLISNRQLVESMV